MDWSSLTPPVVIAIGSLVTACCSFFVALFNFHRSNFAVIKILTSSSSFHADVNRGQYRDFRIVVQNLGIPLHNIGISLGYSPGHGFGWANFPMKTKDGKTTREGQFSKGAIAEFSFATDRLEGNHDGFLRRLTDLKSQSVTLVLHADGYEMWSYRLHDRLWWFKSRWNRIAQRITRGLKREVTTPHGTKGIKYIFQMPMFKSAGQDLLRFAEGVRKSPPADPAAA